MKKATIFIASMLFLGSVSAQKSNDETGGVIYCSEFHITRPLSELVKEHPYDESNPIVKKESGDRENRKAQKFVFSPADGPQYGNAETTMQTTMGNVPGKAPLTNWAGQTSAGFRPFDPSGAVGPNHYVQMINATVFKVYNKTTGGVLLTATLGNLWPSPTPNDGDPIVMYDKAADRWFLAQFGTSGNKIYIAISTTNNPTGTYYTYTFTSPQFPDYLKFSVWQDGYYMTSNQAQKVFCFERTAMLAGSASARSIYKSFSPPQGGGFFVPMPGDAADGTLPPAGTPCPIFSYSDNGWGAGFSDAVNIYKMAVDWVPTTPTATISLAGNVATAAFDGSYSASWDDCVQPGTTQKLDGIGGVIMYRAQWKTWSGYNSVVLNWAVKISASQRSIKWCELRQNQSTGVWSMYQEGIYTPDTDTRWMGGIAMDNNGAIALAYMKSNSSSTYPGLYYTGRRPCDPLGTLPITETVAQAGTGSQTGGVNRDGDYGQMVLDPDGITFWHTSEYMGGATGGSAAKTRIFSFQLPTCVAAAPVANFSGTPTTVCAGNTVTFTDLSSNVPTSWSWSFPGGTPATSTLQSPAVVYSTPGVYSVTLTASNSTGTNTITQTNYITVNATPATPAATSTSPYCAGSTISLSTATVAGATYAWTGPASYTSTSQNPNRPSATTAMSGTYSVTVTTGGCTSAAGTVSVTVNANPTTTAPSSMSVCNGASVPASAFTSTPAGATFNWTNTNTSIGLAASGTGNTPAFTATNTGASNITGTISVTATANGCTGLATNYNITVKPTPATPTISVSGLTMTSSAATGNQWYLNGTIIPGATGQTYTATTNGNYTVVVTTNGCPSAASAITVISTVGIEEANNPYSLSVYPNPNDGNFEVSFTATEKLDYTITLTNALGQLVFKDQLTEYNGKYSKHLNVTEYGKGMYMLTLTNSKNESVKKIIVY